MIDNEMIKGYQFSFIANKDEEGKKACIRDILTVELNSYCNIISGSTTGCFASEELHSAYGEAITALKEHIEDFYLEYLSTVKQEDINNLKAIEDENTFKHFIEYLISTARATFDEARKGNIKYTPAPPVGTVMDPLSEDSYIEAQKKR